MTDNKNPDTTGASDLTALKARADMLGIKYHPNIGAAKLAAKINMKLDGGEPIPNEAEDVVSPAELSEKPVDPETMSPAEFQRWKRSQARKMAGRLIRVRVMNMNPNKKDWEGEIISVGSSRLGTYKKYVPFNLDEGYHIPYIIYQFMKDRKCTVFQTVKGPRGDKIRKGKLINEFSIEVLPPLTKEELEELKRRQAMAGSIDT